VFAGILDQFSGVSLTQKTSFQTQKCSIFDKFTFCESNILTNVCVMNVMMYVVSAGRTDRWVILKINHFTDLHQLSVHPPSPRCPPL